MVRRIDRAWVQFVDPRFSDAQIAEAIGPGRRFTYQETPTPAGTLIRVVGYARSEAGSRPVLSEDDVAGARILAFLVVEFVDVGDRGEVARVTFVLEADEEDFANYG